MRFILTLLSVALFAMFALATAARKSVIITYPENTPDSVLSQAKEAILAAGGTITHEYNIIKAFAAEASVEALETVQALGSKYNAIVEEDQVVHAFSQGQ